MIPLIVNTIAAILTIMVLSRIFGDNPFFRFAQYLFVGVSLGLAFVVAYNQVLRPATTSLLTNQPDAWLRYGVPAILGVLLLPRLTTQQQLSWLANIPLALIFGVGAALAIGGAVAGTILPQLVDTARPLQGDVAQIVGAVVLALGTIITLAMFTYTSRQEGQRGRLVAASAAIGHWLLMIAFGFFFASAVQTYMTALTERVEFVLLWVRGLIGI